MIALSRRRPASITLFAVLFLGAAMLKFLHGLLHTDDGQPFLSTLIPITDWSRDAVIVWHSAWLSIALIPTAMIWLSAVRFARWMVTIMAAPMVLFLLLLDAEKWRLLVTIVPLLLASRLLGLFAVALLFTPASNRWFAQKGGEDPAVFE